MKFKKRRFKIIKGDNDEDVTIYFEPNYKVGYQSKKDAVTKLNYLRKTLKKNRPARVYYDGEYWRLTKQELITNK